MQLPKLAEAMSKLNLDVSRETLDRLEVYERLLAKWTKSINLVAPSTVDDIWNRHIVDSYQIFAHIPHSAKTLVDIGSGGGLPGLVIAAVAAEKLPLLKITLIESDQRKAAFLRTAAREMELQVEVISQRVERLEGVSSDVLTARALAPLNVLFDYATALLKPQGLCIFQKGRTFAAEISDAAIHWQFDVTEYESKTSAEARILLVKGITRVA